MNRSGAFYLMISVMQLGMFTSGLLNYACPKTFGCRCIESSDPIGIMITCQNSPFPNRSFDLNLLDLALLFPNQTSVEAELDIEIMNLNIPIIEQKSLFRDMKLIQMDLSNNQIYEFKYPETVFDSVKRIRFLYMTNNKLANVKRLFGTGSADPALVKDSPLSKLEILGLSRNNLTKIEAYSFNRLRGLEAIQLVASQIQVIEDFAFDGLNELMALDLSSNTLLAFVGEWAFRDLYSLASFRLVNNPLTSFNVSLANMRSLRHFLLSITNVTRISSEIFVQGYTGRANVSENFEDLTEVTISNNPYLVEVGAHTFKRLSKLQQIDFNFNNIKVLDPEIFANLNELIYLQLGFNSLTVLKSYLFNSLPKLRDVDLSFNYIEVIEPYSFYNLTKLNIINLHANNLRIIHSYSFTLIPDLFRLFLTDVFPPRLAKQDVIDIKPNATFKSFIKQIYISRHNATPKTNLSSNSLLTKASVLNLKSSISQRLVRRILGYYYYDAVNLVSFENDCYLTSFFLVNSIQFNLDSANVNIDFVDKCIQENVWEKIVDETH